MGPAPISTAFLLASLVAVAAIEMAAAVIGTSTPLPRLWLIAATRLLQLVAVTLLAVNRTDGLQVLGLGRQSLLPGLRSGLVWSAGFAAAAGLLGLGLFLAGLQPLTWVHSPLPSEMISVSSVVI